MRITLDARPKGTPKRADFGIGEFELSEPGEGEILVRLKYLSVDPYMRGRMNEAKSYVPPFVLGEAITGGAIAEVVASNDASCSVGDLVTGAMRWQNYDVLPASHVRKLEPSGLGLSLYLGVLGMPGLTAYVGLLDIGSPKATESVFVSGAAGAVGSAAGQIAKIKGCTVIGSAGGPDKCRRLGELGFDSVIDYKLGNLSTRLGEVAPNGLDVYFDNVGGDHLIAALEASNNYARFVLCGAISQYNNSVPVPGPPNLFRVIQRRLTLRGFIVSDHFARLAEFERDMTTWIREGKVSYDETVVQGLESAPDAFLGLFSGVNLGKMVVKVDD